jgi:hypothetical protein
MAAGLSVKELTKLLREADIDTTGALEKADLVFLVHTSHDTITPVHHQSIHHIIVIQK